MGRQTPHKLTESGKKMKVSLGKTWAIFFSLRVDAFRRRSPLNTLFRNQQLLLEKWKDLDSGE
jgi:hypothetical protein